MQAVYHRMLLQEALGDCFTPAALGVITAANLHQDALWYQVGHSHFHFDENSFQRGNAYLEEQRQVILQSLQNESAAISAWQAFGRLSHAAQDFYAHSNYVSMWVNKTHGLKKPHEINPLDERLMNSKKLRSGKVYLWEILTYLPLVGRWFKPLVPRDGHAWMNLDSPAQGPYFDFAYAAAAKRTRWEYETTAARLADTSGVEALQFFQGLNEKLKGV